MARSIASYTQRHCRLPFLRSLLCVLVVSTISRKTLRTRRVLLNSRKMFSDISLTTRTLCTYVRDLNIKTTVSTRLQCIKSLKKSIRLHVKKLLFLQHFYIVLSESSKQQRTRCVHLGNVHRNEKSSRENRRVFKRTVSSGDFG